MKKLLVLCTIAITSFSLGLSTGMAAVSEAFKREQALLGDLATRHNACKLEVSTWGSYSNASQGIFQSLNPAFASPSIVLLQPTNNAIFLTPATIRLNANTFDPANSITNVVFYTNGVELAEFTTPPYSLAWSKAAVGTYLLTVSAFCASGLVKNSTAVTVRVDNGGSPFLTISALGDGSVAISGNEILGRAYRIQFLPDLTSTNWQTLGTTVSNAPGAFQFIDSPGSPQGFYRTIFP